MLTTLTTEEVLKMAEQCGLPEFENNESQAANLVMFAKLIAAEAAQHEREACAKVCDGFVNRTQDNYSDLCANAIRARGTNE